MLGGLCSVWALVGYVGSVVLVWYFERDVLSLGVSMVCWELC